ncbi:MAG: oligopeptidase A [Halioglobus sp.]
MSNPLLENHSLPAFSQIKPEHAEPAISTLIERNKETIDKLLSANQDYTWDNLMQPIEDMDDDLARAWSPLGHLNGVLNSDEIREAYNACLPLLSQYSTWMGQHEALYLAYEQIAQRSDFELLEPAQQKAIKNALRDFRLAGVSLSDQHKQRFGEIKQRLSKLGSEFSEHVLDATDAWKMTLTREDLDGLPESALENAKQAAEQAGETGYVITLDFPSYQPVLTYCNNGKLRQAVYEANCTRASALGPNAGQFDNSELITEILNLRQELATLLDFTSYAELSLATKMADSTDGVLEFLNNLAQKSHPQAQTEWQELAEYAASQHNHPDLQPWDAAFFSEKLKQDRFEVSQEEIRPYLPVPTVLNGMFEVANRLYGIEISEVKEFDNYHEDARLFEIHLEGKPIARFYLDLYARSGKRGGAWMDDCRIRRVQAGELQLPVAYLVCNFTPPVGAKPSLLTSMELTTLFHEFGHGLHHMLTHQTVASVSGINGVAWDAVELPSQFLENWCWERDALRFISGHYETGEPLPDTLLEKLLDARNFQSAITMCRQLEFALFDFRLHNEWHGGDASTVQALLDEVREQVAVMIPPVYNKFQNAFSHIFAGGYAAGYYSYKWAEVLSSDAFSRFEEEGIFNPDTGADFRSAILEVGGSVDAMTAFVNFRGREPSIEPLLRHSGIAA